MSDQGGGPLCEHADMHVEGRLNEASNLTLRVQFVVDGEPSEHRGVYKPIDGERPLADFPNSTLALREVAAYVISEAGGWGLIPRTVLRDGPMGMGSVQEWKNISQIDGADLPAGGLMDVVRPHEVPVGWLSVVEGQDYTGAPLTVVHRDDPQLASLAVLDVVLNNADRKAVHIAVDADGALWGFDHGLVAHVEPKLRTVLWGWASTPLPAVDLERLRRLATYLQRDNDLSMLLSRAELRALKDRIERLLADAIYPDVPAGRYPLPWPIW